MARIGFGGGPAGTHQWRSPPTQDTPLVEAASLPFESRLHSQISSPPPTHNAQLNRPNGGGAGSGSGSGALIPPCEHSQSDGDMHAHAFDLLSLSTSSPATKSTSLSPIPSSVPSTSVLSATRPPTLPTPLTTGVKPRRMSSSTTGVLGRGKLGLTGELAPNGRSTSHSSSHVHTSSGSGRRSISSTTTPQLFDFTKTDRRPSHSNSSRPIMVDKRSVSSSDGLAHVAASLPANGSNLHAQMQSSAFKSALRAQALGGEFDMTFDGDIDEDDDGEVGSVDLDMELDVEDLTPEEIKKLALGSGSGGVKGRRKGMVFKCENCGKEYRHPSCLIKHRWEHSPHWQEPTQVSMSKHQQVQMLEAAAILAHLDPAQGRALPTDKSLWPAILSPPSGEEGPLRRPSFSTAVDGMSRDPSSVRSPQSTIAPLTPSSLRDGASTLPNINMQMQQRKSSPGSDSTTSSMGDGYPQTSRPGLNGTNVRPVGINGHANGNHAAASQRQSAAGGNVSSLSSSIPGPGTPHSVGSLPSELAGLHFYHSASHSGSGASPAQGVSPIPNRGMPMSLKTRAGLVGGGMFGAINTSMPSSSVRSGAIADDEDDDTGGDSGSSPRGRGKSSSEEVEERRKAREGEEWGMAMEMEL